jgi:HD-GYP domain-containing protein (c-di-GMP phosphodiesterase class II)
VDEESARHDAYRAVPPARAGGSASAQPQTNPGTETAGLTWQAGPSPTESPLGSYILRQFQQLVDEHDRLRRELSRAHQRLSIVHEISQELSSRDDAAAMEADLLGRYASDLAVAALFLDHGYCCSQVRVGSSGSQPLVVASRRVRTQLAREIETVRRTGRVCHLDLPQAVERGLGHVHALLSPLQQDAQHAHVVIALRRGYQPPFSHDDRLASETILVYGGHILRNLLMVQRLQQASLETVGALANAIEARDHYTGGHSERVGWLAVLTGKALGLPPADLQMLEWSGLLHDVGKIGIPEHILNKPGELTADEFQQIKQHPRLGFDVLSPVSSLKPVLQAVLCHHENFDGSGYPDGLRGDQIPMPARILHVVDIFDALTSTRSYRRRLGLEKALELLAEGAGRTTDPLVTSAFINAFRDCWRSQADECRQRFAHLCPTGQVTVEGCR